MGNKLKGKVAVVTGAGRSIGRGEALALAAEGADVAPMVLFLASDAAANINGYVFGASGGQISLYSQPAPVKSIHKDGRWTLDELEDIIPTTLAAALVNPAPPKQD